MVAAKGVYFVRFLDDHFEFENLANDKKEVSAMFS